MVIAAVPTTQLGSPVLKRQYTRFGTAEELHLPTVRIVAEGPSAEWLAGRLATYVTSESGYWSLSASNWERVLRDVRVLEEIGLVGPQISARTEPPAAPDEAHKLFPEERRFLADNWASLKAVYSGRYIAVLGTSVLDSDISFSALAGRVYGRFGYRRIFMPFIGKPKRVYRIPSPRIVR